MRFAASLRFATLAGAIAALAACRDARPGSTRGERPAVVTTVTETTSTPFALPPSRQRRMAPALNHHRWLRGGSERDTLFAFPRTLAVDDHHLYVLDADSHQVTALRTTDGSLDWHVGGRLDSSLAPVAIAAAPARGLVLADAAHARLLTLGDDGRPLASIPFAAAADARSLCALADGSVLVAGADPTGALLRVSPHETSPTRVPFPWPDLDSRHRLARQISLASSPDAAGCVVALVLGRGFALYDGSRYVARQPYVESFDLPGVTTTTTGDSAAFTRVEQLDDSRVAARDVATSAARVVVAFDGASPLRARVLDLYDRSTGAYSRSVSLPGRIAAVADDGRDIYVAFMRHGRAAVAALPYSTAKDSLVVAPARQLTAR